PISAMNTPMTPHARPLAWNKQLKFTLARVNPTGTRYFRFFPPEFSETPRCSAFCRIAPSVLLNLLAIFLAGVLARASDLNSRTAASVHARRLAFFLGIVPPKLLSNHL